MSTENEDGFGLTALDYEAMNWVEIVLWRSPSAEQLLELEQWRQQSPSHENAYELALRLQQTAGLYSKGSQDHYRATLLNRPATRRAILGGAAAAVVAGYGVAKPPLGLWPSLAELSADFRTGVGQQQRTAIADGVELNLNARTSVSLRNDWNGPGIAVVDGEVAVVADVPVNKTFHAVVGAGRLFVQQATLNIQKDDGEVRITCIRGLVQVQHPSGARQIAANQQLRYSAATLEIPVLVDPVAVTAWQRGLLIFHDTRLDQVVAEVNRYRAGRIVLTNSTLANRRFSGTVRIDRAGEVVDLIRKSTNASTVNLGSVIFLS